MIKFPERIKTKALQGVETAVEGLESASVPLG